jgi:homoaconitase/3-isopropylmalate dehydratase large subunit
MQLTPAQITMIEAREDLAEFLTRSPESQARAIARWEAIDARESAESSESARLDAESLARYKAAPQLPGPPKGYAYHVGQASRRRMRKG